MPTDLIVVVGSGGHAKVVLDAILSSGVTRERIFVTDDDVSRHHQEILGVEIRSLAQQMAREYAFHVAIGGCASRQKVYERHAGAGGQPLTVIHRAAAISPFSTIAGGSFVAAQAVIGPSALVGRGAIVNHGAIVDHDCVVEDFCHVAPNATLGGAVKIGARTFVGAGATILPGVQIGSDCVIGAGAVVLRNVAPGETHVGIPASKMRRS